VAVVALQVVLQQEELAQAVIYLAHFQLQEHLE
jgi:hypothetical protein